MLPGQVLGSEFCENFANFFKFFLVLSRVEFEGTLHDAAVVEIGDIDDMRLFGVLGSSLVFIVSLYLWEESDDDSHYVLLSWIYYSL